MTTSQPPEMRTGRAPAFRWSGVIFALAAILLVAALALILLSLGQNTAAVLPAAEDATPPVWTATPGVGEGSGGAAAPETEALPPTPTPEEAVGVESEPPAEGAEPPAQGDTGEAVEETPAPPATPLATPPPATATAALVPVLPEATPTLEVPTTGGGGEVMEMVVGDQLMLVAPHTIQPGETLAEIAAAADVPLRDLIAANEGILRPNAVVVGAEILIPVATVEGAVEATEPPEPPTETPTTVPTETPTETPTATPTETPTAPPTASPTATPVPPPTPLPMGRAAIGFPITLTVEQGAEIFVEIAAVERVTETAQAGLTGNLIVAAPFVQVERPVRVYPFMRAELSADPADFAVTYTGPGQSGGQEIWRSMASGAAAWRWRVRALRAGQLPVTVSIVGKQQLNDVIFEDVLSISHAIEAVDEPPLRAEAENPPPVGSLVSPTIAGLALVIAVVGVFVRRREKVVSRYADVAPGLEPLRAKQVHDALLSAFPTRDLLAQFTELELGLNLEHVSDVRTLSDGVLDLMRWAQAQGRLGELVEKALTAVPGNPELRKLAADFKTWGV